MKKATNQSKAARFQASLSSSFGRGTVPAQPFIRFFHSISLRIITILFSLRKRGSGFFATKNKKGLVKGVFSAYIE